MFDLMFWLQKSATEALKFCCTNNMQLLSLEDNDKLTCLGVLIVSAYFFNFKYFFLVQLASALYLMLHCYTIHIYVSSHINGELVSRQREWSWFHCSTSIREHAKLHLMLHTSVAISMKSLSQDKENNNNNSCFIIERNQVQVRSINPTDLQ
jgi:hypothetical protein